MRLNNDGSGRPKSQETPTYSTRHRAISDLHGSAKTHDCFFGFHPAEEWSWLSELCDDYLIDESYKTKDNGLKYCLHDEHYAPVCKEHHRLMDGVFDKREGIGLMGMWNEIAVAEVPGVLIA